MVEQKLNELVKEFQDGKHEGSILSVATVDSLAQDEKETWRAIRKELEDIGISVAAFDANKDFIMGWFHEALSTGAFDERINSDDPDFNSDAGSISSQMDDRASLTKEAAKKDSLGMPGGQVSSPATTPRPSKTSIAPARSGTTSSKNRSQPRKIIALFTRLRGYDNAFIESLSVNDLARATQLWSKGANIHALYTGSNFRRNWPAICVAAAQSTNVRILRWLLDNGADVQARTPDKYTPLHLVAGRQLELEIFDMLLARGADIDTIASDGRTPLCSATLVGNVAVARGLLQHGAKCNTLTQNSWTPLMFAARGGFIFMVHLLVDFGAHVNMSNNHKETALIIAARSEILEAKEVVQLLLRRGAYATSCDVQQRTALWYAVANGNIDMVRVLLEHGANPNDCSEFCTSTTMSYECPALEAALKGDHTAIAQLLVENGADVNALDPFSGEPMLHIVVGNPHTSASQELVGLMLKHGVNLERVYGGAGTALDKVVCDRHFGWAVYLLDQGAINNEARYKADPKSIQETGIKNSRQWTIIDGYKWLADTYKPISGQLVSPPVEV